MKYFALILMLLFANVATAEQVECGDTYRYMVGHQVMHLDTLEIGAVAGCVVDEEGAKLYRVAIDGKMHLVPVSKVARYEFVEPDLSDLEVYLVNRM